MKKLFFLISFVVCGIAVTLGGNKNFSGHLVSSEKPQIIKSGAPSENNMQTERKSEEIKALPTVEELEKRYERLSIKEVEILIHDLEKSGTATQLISKANKGELTEEEKANVIKIIRTKAALIKLAFERKYEELELL